MVAARTSDAGPANINGKCAGSRKLPEAGHSYLDARRRRARL